MSVRTPTGAREAIRTAAVRRALALHAALMGSGRQRFSGRLLVPDPASR